MYGIGSVPLLKTLVYSTTGCVINVHAEVCCYYKSACEQPQSRLGSQPEPRQPSSILMRYLGLQNRASSERLGIYLLIV